LIRKTRWLAFALPLASLVAAPLAFADLIEVPGHADTIGEAVAMASEGDEVHVSPGVYYEHDIAVKSGVSIIGIGGDDSAVIIDASGLGRIFWCENVDSTTVLSNLTLTGGLATGDNTYDSSGGAMLCSHSQPQIIDCDFLHNSAESHGGAVRVTHASPRFWNCRFIGNSAALGGGALDLIYGAEPLIEYCYFEGNSAAWGGGVSARSNSHPNLNSAVMLDNVAAGTYGYGGGLYCDYESTPVIHWTTLRGNEARYGGAVAAFDESSPWLGSCTIVENLASVNGGGLYCKQSSPYIRQTIIAFQEGAAIGCNLDAQPFLECADIFGNTGGDWVGAIATQLDLRYNMCADPMFCDGRGPYGSSLALQDESPCAEENNDCGLMGAWESGCGIDSISIESFLLAEEDDKVRAIWQLVTAQPDAEFRLEAVREGLNPATWVVPYEQRSERTYVAIDDSEELQYGGKIAYSIYYQSDDDEWQLLKTARIDLADLIPGSQIEDAFPNPFNSNTTVRFTMGRPGHVRIAVYDINGRLVTTLADGEFAAGRHSIGWDATSARGAPVSSGTYFLVMETEERIDTQKLLLLK
jgi:hypothetical protein